MITRLEVRERGLERAVAAMIRQVKRLRPELYDFDLVNVRLIHVRGLTETVPYEDLAVSVNAKLSIRTETVRPQCVSILLTPDWELLLERVGYQLHEARLLATVKGLVV